MIYLDTFERHSEFRVAAMNCETIFIIYILQRFLLQNHFFEIGFLTQQYDVNYVDNMDNWIEFYIRTAQFQNILSYVLV